MIQHFRWGYEGCSILLFPAYAQNAKNVAVLAESSLNNEELFLANGFKTMFDSKLALMIAQWMDKNAVVIYRSDSNAVGSQVLQNRRSNRYSSRRH